MKKTILVLATASETIQKSAIAALPLTLTLSPFSRGEGMSPPPSRRLR